MMFSFGVIACIAIAAACREPTQITLRITTGEKCTDLTGVQIVVGSSAEVTQTRFTQRFAAAVTHTCTPDGSGNLIGTLVITPGTSAGTVVVSAGVNTTAAQGPDPADCADPTNAKRCIIARRSFSFIDHTSLTLPIDLDPLCVGQSCDPASTCFKGSCVPDTVGCQGSDCGLPQETGTGSGADATSSDGAYDADFGDAFTAEDTGVVMPLDSGSDSGTVSADSGKDASATFDAGGAVCGTTGFGMMTMSYCYAVGMGGVGESPTGVTTSGTCADPSNKSSNCCHCKCPVTDLVVSCDVALMSSGSCQPKCQ